MRVPLFTPGNNTSLDLTQPINGTIILNTERVNSDWDPFVAIGDGTNLIGVNFADNSGGSGVAHVRADAGNTYGGSSASSTLFTSGSGFPGNGVPFDLQLDYTLNGTTTDLTLTSPAGGGSATLPSGLDINQPLSFFFFAGGNNELYQFNSLDVEFTGQVFQEIPEPGTFVLWGLVVTGALGFAWWRRRDAAAA